MTGHGCATLNQPDIDETRTCGEYAGLIRTSSSQTEWIQNSAASEIQLENHHQKGRPAEKSERSTKDYFWNKTSRRTIGQYTNRMLGNNRRCPFHSCCGIAWRGPIPVKTPWNQDFLFWVLLLVMGYSFHHLGIQIQLKFLQDLTKANRIANSVRYCKAKNYNLYSNTFIVQIKIWLRLIYKLM